MYLSLNVIINLQWLLLVFNFFSFDYSSGVQSSPTSTHKCNTYHLDHMICGSVLFLHFGFILFFCENQCQVEKGCVWMCYQLTLSWVSFEKCRQGRSIFSNSTFFGFSRPLMLGSFRNRRQMDTSGKEGWWIIIWLFLSHLECLIFSAGPPIWTLSKADLQWFLASRAYS